MKEESIIQVKSYSFAIRIVKLYQFLNEKEKFNPLAKQVLRSGTSIGANIEEATGALSDRDFLSRISVSYREGRETKFWLRLLKDTHYLEDNLSNSLISDCDELLRIISRIQLTIKSKIKNSSKKTNNNL